ncbi:MULTISPECIES: hypothetical protein [Kitasatospora]|uniref:hypothetical protein n=1 Tax=Kitasatospora TaxID=2063 RepID=UPI0035E0793D
MEHPFLLLALTVYLFTNFRYHRKPRDEHDLGKLVYARIGARRTTEIWRRGVSFDIQVYETH